ncbi:MAG: SurA N-terminal domain-containing protein [Methylovirgula sp.]|jgi:peptidyl-prolyl cis-trans isomerase D
MLDALRAATQSWFGRIIMGIVMGLLIIAFGFWGIADIFRGFGANDLARVGSQTISVDAYRFAYQSQLQQLQQRERRAITNDEARRMGLDREVLARLLSNAILDQTAHHFGLALSDHDLALEIVQDPAFKGPDGKFDQQDFDNRLQEMGFTEQRFIAEQRLTYLRRQIITALSYGLTVPNAMKDAIHRFYGEIRSIDFLVLPKASITTVKPPSDADLQAYYDARLDDYRTHEFRKIVVLPLTLQDLSEQLAKKNPISDADVKKHYDEVKAQRFTQAETRHIEQIPFADQAAAEAAEKKLAGGESFDALIAERKLSAKDVDLGTVAKDSMVDKTIADAAFSLPAGKVSDPVKGKFGWVLLRVDKIIPATVIPFEQVELPLRQEMGLVRARKEIDRLHDLIEDQRASGKSLTDAAAAAGLTARTIDAVDAQGYDKSGQAVPDVPDEEALVKAVFASDVGVDNEPLTTKDGGTIWFEIANVEPARQLTFNEVKSKVTDAWMDDERAKELSAEADADLKKLDGGETLAALAMALKLTVAHKDGIKRSGGAGLSQPEVTQIFDQKVGTFGSASTAQGDRLIFKIVDAKVPPVDPKDADYAKTVEGVSSGISEDLLAQYLTDWEHKLGVSVNEQALRTAISSE